MRPLILSAAGGLVLAGAVLAQTTGNTDSSTGVSQLPVGQVYKQFQFPYYQEGHLKFVLTATDATGITINRAETHNLKIDLYSGDKVTTTITSPDADLYVTDHKLRTHNSVRIDRADLSATSKLCDFDLVSKQYVMRTNVKVTLLHFDAGQSMKGSSTNAAPAVAQAPAPPPPSPVSIPRPTVPPPPTIPTNEGDGLIDSPGSYSTPSNGTTPAPLPQ